MGHPAHVWRRITYMLRTIPTSLGPVAVRIHSGSVTNATPWVLLHGASGSWRTFNRTISGFVSDACTGPEQDLVIIDLPGWGDSPARIPFTIEEQGRAVIEVLTALNYAGWRILGHSMGGVLALEIAAAAPRVTLAVVVVSPTARTAAAALRKPFQHPGMAPLVGMYGIMRLLRAVGPATPILLSAARRTGLLRIILAPFFARPSTMTTEVFDDLALDIRPASFLAAADALLQYDVERWRSIATSVLLVRGEKDIFTPQGELDELSALIPGARTAVMPGTGHFAHLEDTQALSQLARWA